MPVQVRRATLDDVPGAAATLAAAFRTYPWTTWTVGNPDRLEELYALLIEHVALEHGEVWVTDDLAAVAVWTTPDAARGFDRVAEEVVALMLPRGIEAQELAASRGAPARWSLDLVGVRPDRQGAGLGRAVLAPRLERCDEDHEPATLQTTSLGNVRFYEGLGFGVVDVFDAPGGGPRCWVMRRP